MARAFPEEFLQGVDVPVLTIANDRSDLVIEIGGLPIRLWSEDPAFVQMLKERYAGFVASTASPKFDFDIELVPPGAPSDGQVRVEFESGQWCMDRGDFHAEWNPAAARGLVRQTANRYSIDCVLRIVHTLLLAKDSGFLVHSASVVRNGRAFLFAGVSGAGKTTIASLAPPDATLLTDEISYVCRQEGQYCAFGTPFAGDLGRAGDNVCAPIAALYILAQGAENKIESLDPAEAGRALLENILFFANDPETVRFVFEAACEFISRVPTRRLTFMPDSRVWEMIT
jgi:hypothetical protein